MKIAVNTRWLLPDKLEGFGWYTFHVLNRLVDLIPDATFYFISDRKHKIKLIEKLNAEYFYINPPARHPILWYIWNEISVPLALRKIKPDLYFSPDGFLPSNLKIPTITTIHDLNFEDDDNFLKRNVRKYYRKHIREAAKNATHILTVSTFSKTDIVKRYSIAPEKITALHNGPQTKFTDYSRMRVSTQQKYGGSKPYFLFVGAQNPRKNLHRIFAAFDAFLKKTGAKQNLVLVGERMLWDDEIRSAWENMEFKNHVLFTGRLKTQELNEVYSAATALVFPSLHEGFGMPIIEAFASGCPVITSTTTAMPEVAGRAAIMVDPLSEDEIEAAMEKMISDPELLEELREKGFERAKLFNWDEVAEEIAVLIKKLVRA